METAETIDSPLVKHAEDELRRAGLFDKDSMYGGMLAEAVMDLVRAHAGQGHSGYSHATAIQIFNQVANFKTLTPITSDPSEWNDVSGPSGRPMWQSKRQPSLFSEDGGKTWYDVDAPRANEHATLRSANEARQKEWDRDERITLAYRGNELAGEVGEACNVVKKLERERLGIRGSRATKEQLADELADVVICTDLVAMAADIDLDEAVARKFNATSEKNGLQTRLVPRKP